MGLRAFSRSRRDWSLVSGEAIIEGRDRNGRTPILPLTYEPRSLGRQVGSEARDSVSDSDR